MTKDILAKMLQDIISEKITLVSYEEESCDKVQNPRANLLAVFRRRLRGLDKGAPIYVEVKRFVDNLGELDVDSRLYSWSCVTKYDRWVGWASEDCILYKVKSSSKNPR